MHDFEIFCYIYNVEKTEKYILRYDLVFATWRAVLFFLRRVLAAIVGGTECVVCGTETGAVPICKNCRELYDVNLPNDETRCRKCGKILLSEDELCMECRKNKIFCHTDLVFPLYTYRLWNKTLLFTWKMKSVRSLSDFFATRVAEAARMIGSKIIVPVPPRRGKIREKGWDQIEELCSLLEHAGFTVCRMLERVSDTEQKKLGREGRLSTTSAAYKLKTGNFLSDSLKKIGGKIPEEVLLIDDVITTGSTVESCAKELKSAGVKKVNVIALFIVD